MRWRTQRRSANIRVADDNLSEAKRVLNFYKKTPGFYEALGAQTDQDIDESQYVRETYKKPTSRLPKPRPTGE